MTFSSELNLIQTLHTHLCVSIVNKLTIIVGVILLRATYALIPAHCVSR